MSDEQEPEGLRVAIVVFVKGKEPNHGWGTSTLINDAWADGYRTACCEIAAAIEQGKVPMTGVVT